MANVSHELRTPLASIRALADTLEGGAIDDREVAYDFSRRIVDESERLTTLVDELLDLAAIESGRMRIKTSAVAPGELLRASAERLSGQLVAAQLYIGDRCAVDAAAGRSRSGEDRTGGAQSPSQRHQVHTGWRRHPDECDRARRRRVEFTIADSGEGIQDEELTRIFERFYKGDRARTSQGTGLGLAISKHIVQAHGGEIWAEAGTRPGATIKFTLPRSPQVR